MMGRRRMTLLSLATILLLSSRSSAVYLPGVAPVDYSEKDTIPLYVYKISSSQTQLPYRYYDLPFCGGDEEEEFENLGMSLMGDRIEKMPYKFLVWQETRCQQICRRQYVFPQNEELATKIEQGYRATMMLDNLPVVGRLPAPDDPNTQRLERGMPLGYTVKDSRGEVIGTYLYNHLVFIVKGHRSDKGYRIVGFEVEPHSIQHTYDGEFRAGIPLKTCSDGITTGEKAEPQRIDEPREVIYTYDITWQLSETPWSQRWDLYLMGADDTEVHWFSMLNASMIVLFLSAMIATILVRALHRDISRYNATTIEDAQEETGWKLVHGDVFRPPRGFFGPMLLSVFVGSGVQILSMALVLMIFAVLGFLSPANRGGLLTALLLLFVFMGSAAGYVSARVYKMFRGKAWKRNTLLTALAFPGSIFATVFFLNFFVWSEGSSGAIPFTSMLLLLLLWFGVSVPLVFVGAFFGFKKEEVKPPVRVTQIPRQVPPQPWYLLPIPSILVGGILPFGAVFVELFFIMSSIWQSHVYYMFGFLALVLIIVVVACAEISIVMTYFQLCAEDYNWWWRSFLTSGAAAIYVFLYSILYFVTQLHQMEMFVSILLYFSYMALASWAFFLLCGSIGFLSSLWFVRKIYGSIKVD